MSADRLDARISGGRVWLISVPIDPPFISGIHQIDRIYNVVVELDCAGATGVGFTFGFRRAEALACLVLVEELVNEVRNTPCAEVRSTHCRAVAGRNFAGPLGPSMMAVSAVDMAMWDVHARVLDISLHNLLGLRPEARPVYMSGGSLALTEDELVAEAKLCAAAGFRGYKMRVGSADIGTDVARVDVVRQALGPHFPLMVDANQAWSRQGAAAGLAELERFGLRWAEEPLEYNDVSGLRRLRELARIPIAAGESCWGGSSLVTLIRAGAVDIVQPDLMRCGGITGYQHVAAYAAAEGVTVAPHLFTDVAAQLVGLAPDDAWIEYLPGWFDHLFGAPAHEFGELRPRPGAGLGLQPSWKSDPNVTVEHQVDVDEVLR